jgi:hypothetical protein
MGYLLMGLQQGCRTRPTAGILPWSPFGNWENNYFEASSGEGFTRD